MSALRDMQALKIDGTSPRNTVDAVDAGVRK